MMSSPNDAYWRRLSFSIFLAVLTIYNSMLSLLDLARLETAGHEENQKKPVIQKADWHLF